MKEAHELIEEQDQRLALHTEKLRAENQAKDVQIAELERLVHQRHMLLERMRAAVQELDEENARIERDVEEVLARAA